MSVAKGKGNWISELSSVIFAAIDCTYSNQGEKLRVANNFNSFLMFKFQCFVMLTANTKIKVYMHISILTRVVKSDFRKSNQSRMPKSF